MDAKNNESSKVNSVDSSIGDTQSAQNVFKVNGEDKRKRSFSGPPLPSLCLAELSNESADKEGQPSSNSSADNSNGRKPVSSASASLTSDPSSKPSSNPSSSLGSNPNSTAASSNATSSNATSSNAASSNATSSNAASSNAASSNGHSVLRNPAARFEGNQRLFESRQNYADTRLRYMSADSSNSVYRGSICVPNRPRSNSEGKSKKPNLIMSTLRKSVHLPWTNQHHHKHAHNHMVNCSENSSNGKCVANCQTISCPVTPSTAESKSLNPTCPVVNCSHNCEDKPRSRSSSGSSANGNFTGQMSRILEIFRNRSLSMGYNDCRKRLDIDCNDSNHPNSLFRRHSVDPESRRNRAFQNRSLDVLDFHHNHFSLYRETKASRNGSFNPFTSTESICDRLDFDDLEKDEHLIYVKFFQFYHCYDLVPISSKLVVFDTQLLVKKAFYALVNHGVRAAPLWDSEKQMFVGMLTITYFINVLINSYKNDQVQIDKLDEQKIECWKNIIHDKRPLISIDPEASVFDAIEILIKNKIHRLPIVDPASNNVIYILTHKRILKFFFLYCYYLPMPSYMNFTIKQLNVGTYVDIEMTTMDSKLIDVMRKFVERRISALPVVDKDGKLIDIYSKFNLFNLAAEKMYSNLDISIKEALEYRKHWYEGVVKCVLEDSFINVLEKIVKAEVHRVVVVDSEDYVVGIISLSDILHFLSLKPAPLISRKVITNETLNEESNEEIVNMIYNNNDNSIKNHNHFGDDESEGYSNELQKIDEV